MRRLVATLAVVCIASTIEREAAAQIDVRVGICARSITVAAAPFAIATKLGWYAQDGIKVELAPNHRRGEGIQSTLSRDNRSP
jgi:NitT/TauT family transport system substrate-binding protein